MQKFQNKFENKGRATGNNSSGDWGQLLGADSMMSIPQIQSAVASRDSKEFVVKEAAGITGSNESRSPEMSPKKGHEVKFETGSF